MPISGTHCILPFRQIGECERGLQEDEGGGLKGLSHECIKHELFFSLPTKG